MMVETHVTGKKLEVAAQELARSRWRLDVLEAYETGRGGTSGGHLFCAREGQATYRLHHFDHEGNGFLANVLQRQNWEVVLVSIYLKCGEDINSKANAIVLGALAAFLGELAVPWIVVGDFQVPPAQWQGHHLVQTGQPTLITGAELDYVVASRNISPFVDIKVNWDVLEATRRTAHDYRQYCTQPSPATTHSICGCSATPHCDWQEDELATRGQKCHAPPGSPLLQQACNPASQ